MNRALVILTLVLCSISLAAPPVPSPFYIRVIDNETGRPVPLVSFRSINQLRLFSDNNGIVAVDQPEFVGKEIYFHISSHGYEIPEADGFGFRGAKFKIIPGKSAEVRMKRRFAAERLYRITGSGRVSHSLKAGLCEPNGNIDYSGNFGCDSVLNASFKNRLYWIWGDTNRGSYPLGNFHSTGATSSLDLDVETGIPLDYFKTENGDFVKPMAKLPGEGPTWLTGLAVFPDRSGTPHLVATYQKVKDFLTVYQTGLCEFNESTNSFEKITELDLKSPLPYGHPFPFTDPAGEEWMIYADPLPTLKIPLSYEAWKDPQKHQPVETKANFTNLKTGEKVNAHRGSLAWNEHRKKWVMIFTETFPKRKESDDRSQLGEVFYAESDSPFGPWQYCIKIATHHRYSFYNPKQHPYFQKQNGRIIYFEGTYTSTFSRASLPTPRYDYNQILYRLDIGKIPGLLDSAP